MKNMNSTVDLDVQYQDKIKDISFQPVFIMGLQRSGTSILYKMLGATNCFNVVTAYHIINYNELLHNYINNLEGNVKDNLAEFFRHQSQMTRRIDRLQITPDFPEEYGFLLAQKTKQSRLNQNNLSLFTELCKKIQFISNSEKPLLMKNPFDFSNFTFIEKKFPNSKFVFIHRNPMKTLNSQLKAMRALLKSKSPYMVLLSPQYDEIFKNKLLLTYYRFLYSSITPIRSITAVRKLAKATDYFLKNINALNDDDYVCTKYEDICKDPDSEIRKILNFLKIKTTTDLQYRDFIKPRKTSELRELQILRSYILKKTKKYLSRCGYALEDKL